jgi:hypothetical protein
MFDSNLNKKLDQQIILVHDPFVPTPDSPEWQNQERLFKHHFKNI